MTNATRPARIYIAGAATRQTIEAAALLDAHGFLTTTPLDAPSYSSARSVSDLLSIAREDLAALRAADVVVILPGDADHLAVLTAQAYGVPTLPLAALLAVEVAP